MANWIDINTDSGKKIVVNIDKVAYAKLESGMLYFYNEIDGSLSAKKLFACTDKDGTFYSKLMDIIAKGGD